MQLAAFKSAAGGPLRFIVTSWGGAPVALTTGKRNYSGKQRNRNSGP